MHTKMGHNFQSVVWFAESNLESVEQFRVGA